MRGAAASINHTNQDRKTCHTAEFKIPSPHTTSIPSATTPVLLLAREHRPRLMAASAAHSSSVVPVAGDATASHGALASLRRPRSARSETDGGNNARADNHGTASDDTKGTLRSRGLYRRRPSDLPRRITGAHCGAHQPAQHPLGAGAARFLAVRQGKLRRALVAARAPALASSPLIKFRRACNHAVLIGLYRIGGLR